MKKALLNVVSGTLLVLLAVLVLGPMCAGLLDAMCWFATGHACTPIKWSPPRVAWACSPLFFVVLVAISSA